MKERKVRKGKRPLSWRKKASDDDWKAFRELLRREMKEVKEIKRDDIGQKEIDETWKEWLRIVTKAADDSIGRQKRLINKQTRLDWDSKLAKLVEGQNSSRKNRDSSEGETRKRAQAEYREKRMAVKKEGESRQEETE